MSPDRSRQFLWMAVVAVGVAAACLGVRSTNTVREVRLRVESKRSDLRRLKGMEAEVQRGEAAKQAVERKPARPAEALLPLAQAEFAGYKAEDCRETRREQAPGWIVRQTEMSFDEIPFAAVMEFARKVEADRPPWRLATCMLRASPMAPGTGRAVLQFEVLQRRE